FVWLEGEYTIAGEKHKSGPPQPGSPPTEPTALAGRHIAIGATPNSDRCRPPRRTIQMKTPIEGRAPVRCGIGHSVALVSRIGTAKVGDRPDKERAEQHEVGA